jgi:hypothetical protein
MPQLRGGGQTYAERPRSTKTTIALKQERMSSQTSQTSQASVDPDLLDQTRQQIRGLVSEIESLSRSDVAPPEFYEGFLNRVVQALAAEGGAVWVTGEGGRLELAYQINLRLTRLADRREDQEKHGRLLRRADRQPDRLSLGARPASQRSGSARHRRGVSAPQPSAGRRAGLPAVRAADVRIGG